MSLAAKKNKPGTVTNLEQYTSLEKVFQSNQDSVELFAKKLDLEKEEISKIDFYLNATNLLAKTKYPQTIRFKAYTKNLDGKTAIVKVVDSTVFNSREAQALFINLLVPESFQSEDLYIDIYDSNLDLAASFKHFVTKTATASSQSIDAASCSQSNFGECNLDYILNAIDFELVPGKEAQSVISKDITGDYKIKLPIVKRNKLALVSKAAEASEALTDVSSIVSILNNDNFQFDQISLEAKELTPDNIPEDGSIEFDGQSLYITKQGERHEIPRRGPKGIRGPTGAQGKQGLYTGTNPVVNSFVLISADDPPAGPSEGDLYYDSAPAACMYLAGSWQKIAGEGSCAAGTDQSPNAFNFTDRSYQPFSVLVNSEILTFTGFDNAPITISGDGSPMYSINSGPFTSAPGTLYAGQTLQLQLTSNGNPSTVHSATVNIGTGADTWMVTTSACPENFAFIPGSANRDKWGFNNTFVTWTGGWCVSQYEMSPQDTSTWTRAAGSWGWHYSNSSGTGKAVTAKGGGDSYPITNITPTEAQAACQNDLTTTDGTPLSNGELLTTYFWSSIAQAIVDDGVNWSGGTPGAGNLSRGNSDNTDPLPGIAEDTEAVQPNAGVFYYTGAQGRSWRLGSGFQSIYDFAGNVSEWYDDLHDLPGSSSLYDIDGSTANFNFENNNGLPVPLLPTERATHDNTDNGVGRIYARASSPTIDGTGFYSHYGGTWDDQDFAGVFGSNWQDNSNSASFYTGFRCIIPLGSSY